MTPSVRSRLIASGVAFALGFAVANYGILMVPQPDQWLWLAVAALFMLTAGAGVLFADTRRGLSIWAVLGVELFVIFTLAPVLWMASLATTPAAEDALTLWPRDPSGAVFSQVFDDGALWRALANSLIPAAIATVVAIALAAGVAHAMVRGQAPGRRWVYLAVVALALAPLLTIAVPMSGAFVSFGWADSRWTTAFAQLAVTLPLAIWLLVTVFRQARWDLVDAARVEGGLEGRALWRQVTWPAVLPGVAVSAVIVFVVACQDFVIGAALSATDASRPLPATLLLVAGDPAGAPTVAAVGLLWLAPVALILAVLSGRIIRLLGRSQR